MAEREYARNKGLIDGIFEARTVQRALDLTNSKEAGAKLLAKEPRFLKAIERLRLAQYEQVYDELGTPFGDTEEGFGRWLRMQSREEGVDASQG